MNRYLIVGGGPAGVGAAASIRQQDPDGPIVILDRDPDPPYYRTELDTYIGGSTPEPELPLHPPEFYRDQRLDLHLSTAVAEVRPADRAVVLAEGTSVEYDALLLAPGSAPVPPPWPGADLAGVMTVRTWEDARQVIARMAQTTKRVVVVGGGVLGVILAEGLRQREKAVLLLEREATLWAPLLDQPASTLVERAMQEAGIEVATDEAVAETTGDDGQVRELRTTKGRRVETDLVLVTIGARPEVGFLQGSGVNIDRGILIDHEFRTNVPGVFAAGDAAQAYDPLTGLFRVVTSWNNAMEQGRLAGLSMAGAPTLYKGLLAANSEALCGLRVSVMGLTQVARKGMTVLTGRNDAQRLYRRLLLREDKLVGALLVGSTAGEGMMKKFIVDGRSLSVADAKSKWLTGMVIDEGN